jgi:NitT/TauT family transport system ATP-binding protein
MFGADGCSCPLNIGACANIERAISVAVCQYFQMVLPMPISLKSDDPGATLQADGRDPFLNMAEPVRMSNAAEATNRTDPAPQRLAVDVRNVSLTFETADGNIDALSDVSLQVADGEFVSFIGPSGCGKTTMLRVIADLQQPTSGSLKVNGMSAEQARLGRSYGYVFQAPALFPWRTIEKNLKLPLEIMGFSESEQQQRAERYLALVNLTGFERKFPWQLSGGMQQRVSIARALSFDPDLLLMDEPFGALDEIVRDHLNEQLLQLWDKTGKTVLFVTHSIPEAVFLSTKIVVMSPRPGRITDIIDCNFPRDRTLEIRETPEFLKIAQRVRVGLRAGHSYDE